MKIFDMLFILEILLIVLSRRKYKPLIVARTSRKWQWCLAIASGGPNFAITTIDYLFSRISRVE